MHSRDTIFISHAVLPKDNEFVLWLASRLQMLGYKVWCDLNMLKGGEEDFWGKVIEPQIREHTAKFILVISKAGILKQGVIDEFSFARAIAKENNLNDFVIPIRIEDVPFTSRIGINTYNVIDCSENWQTALNSLMEKFEIDNVPKGNVGELNDSFKQLISNSKTNVYYKKEEYYSTWLKPVDLPSSYFIFQYETEAQCRAILKSYYFEYPTIRHGNCLVSFHNQINFSTPKNTNELDFDISNVSAKRVMEINCTDENLNKDYSSFPTLKDRQYLLKRLLNQSINLLIVRRGVKIFEMSNKRYCYYFSNNYRTGNKALVRYPNRVKKKNLVGKFFDDYWHFGISINSILTPDTFYNIKTHILFSSDGINIWENDSKRQTARKKKGRTWYNEHWRDQTMAFLAYLKKDTEDNYLCFPVCETHQLKIPLLTESYISEFGYNEPNSEDRMDIINSLDEVIEKEEEINVE
jgi:hypothetical protein